MYHTSVDQVLAGAPELGEPSGMRIASDVEKPRVESSSSCGSKSVSNTDIVEQLSFSDEGMRKK